MTEQPHAQEAPLEDEIQKLRRDINVLEIEIERLRRERDYFRRLHEASRLEKIELNRKIEELSNKIASLTYEQEQLVGTYRRQLEDLGRIIEELKSENERLSNKNAGLTYEQEKLKDTYFQQIERERKICEELKSEIKKLSKKVARLTHEQDELKDNYRQQLERDGRICSRDCVLCVIVWICRNKLDELSGPYCNRLLENIIILEEAKNITKEDLKCGKFMRMLLKCGIVTKGEVIYHAAHEQNKFETMHLNDTFQAWNTLNWNNESVFILATMKADGVGHAMVVDGKLRNEHGYVKVYDPQNEGSVFASLEFVETYVNKAKDLTDVIMFSVNLEKLKQIVEKNIEILHFTNAPNTPGN